jgi:hypothetical protein
MSAWYPLQKFAIVDTFQQYRLNVTNRARRLNIFALYKKCGITSQKFEECIMPLLRWNVRCQPNM